MTIDHPGQKYKSHKLWNIFPDGASVNITTPTYKSFKHLLVKKNTLSLASQKESENINQHRDTQLLDK